MWVGRLLGKPQRKGRGAEEGIDREFLPFMTGVDESGPYKLVGVSSEPELERGNWLRTSFVHFGSHTVFDMYKMALPRNQFFLKHSINRL